MKQPTTSRKHLSSGPKQSVPTRSVPRRIYRRHLKDHQQYVRRFIRFSQSIEDGLKKTLVVLFVLLVIVQAMLQFSDIRMQWSEVERLEGRVFAE